MAKIKEIDYTFGYRVGSKPFGKKIINCSKCGKKGELTHYSATDKHKEINICVHHKTLFMGIAWDIDNSCHL